ncbi:AUR protein kinase [Kwoniella mangroviensis CBS 10435]|uniref:Aurora kinase n=1 Tax=Kwoniella mangroviensis CBS 10435 TaxID=1331196 RepID=A0A1B9IEU5_9TREE|nr:AUR protein kinase [Kwoniella mangroviensis CBS 10435]OCF73950.1 AUR protein kinase [Kwoniella mangroviensis CBS 8886]
MQHRHQDRHPSSTESTGIGIYDGGFEQIPHVPATPERVAQHRQLDDDFERAGPSKHWSLANFDIGRPLGKGHFGKVYLARVKSKTDPFVLVLKCLSKDEVITKEVQIQVRREIEVMQQLRHPNIIRLYGWFHDSTRIFLMLELAGKGELFKQLAKKGRFSERRSSQYIRQVASGLTYLHSNQIIHRDIKPENLLLGMNGEIKIGDFGWSVYSPEENSQRTLAGTLSYVSPEMVLGQPYGKAVDIWALGVLAYELTCGAEPFGADTSSGPRLVHQRICTCDVHFPSFLSVEAREFIQSLLRLKPEERLPLDQVDQQPWILNHL